MIGRCAHACPRCDLEEARAEIARLKSPAAGNLDALADRLSERGAAAEVALHAVCIVAGGDERDEGGMTPELRELLPELTAEELATLRWRVLTIVDELAATIATRAP